MYNFLKKILSPKDINETKAPQEIYRSFYSSAGTVVTPETALKTGAVWRAVDLISSQVAKMPCHLRKTNGELIEKAVDDPRYNLVKAEPEHGVTAFTFFKTLVSHVALRGNGYAYILRDSNFKPIELWVIPPEYVLPQRVDGEVFYLVKLKDKAYRIDYFSMLHVKGLGYDGLQGYSVIEYFATDCGLSQAMRDYSAEFFANGAVVDKVVSPTTPLDKANYELLLKSWKSEFTGSNNRHKTAVSPSPLDIKAISNTARDSQLIEARAFSIRDIANWFGIPPHKLGDNSRTAYNSIEAENMAFLSDTLDAHLVNIEQEMNIKLLTEDEKRKGLFFFEFNRDSLLRTDTATRYNSLIKATGAPILTVNEARRIENFNPIEGKDTLLQPLNMGDSANVQQTN